MTMASRTVLRVQPVDLERLERVAGIEPAYSAWKAAALPLCYTRPMPAKHGIEPTSARSNIANAARTITSTRYVRQDGNDGVNVALTWQLVQGLSGA